MPVVQAPGMQGGVNLQQLMSVMQQFQQGAGFPQPQLVQSQPQMQPNLGAMFSQFTGQSQQAGSASASTSYGYEDPERKRVRDGGQYDDQYDNQWSRGKRTKANDPKPVSFCGMLPSLLSRKPSNTYLNNSTRLDWSLADSGRKVSAERATTAPSGTTLRPLLVTSVGS